MKHRRSRRSPVVKPTFSNRKRGLCLFFFSSIVIGGLSVPAASAQAAAASGLVISHAWVRFIMPSRPAAGYFTLSNATGRARALIGASSPACKTLMLHQSVHKNGVESMAMLKDIVVPAHGSVAFAPNDYHLMCMSPTTAMRVGSTVPVTLVFADGTSLESAFTVKGAADAGR